MKSNKSLFNATLFKSNIKRFLPFSILFLIIELINFPLILFFNYISSSSYSEGIAFEDHMTMGVASDAFAFIFAGVFSILVFSYLFSTNKCNALHAFPIGRKALFTTNLLSAYVLLIVPQLIGFGVSVPLIIMFSQAAVAKAVILLQLATIFLFSFIVLSTGVLSMLLAGNAFSGAVIYFFINFLYTALIEIASFFASVFGVGLSENALMGETSSLLSPVVCLISKKTEYYDDFKPFVSDYYKYLVIYFAVAFAICALSYLIYKLRELECAGEMVAFEIENPFIRVIVSIINASAVSIVIGSIFSLGRIGYIVFYIVFSFIFYFSTQMILKKKWNIFSANLIIRWLICCALSIGIALGIAAYETNYIPDSKKVVSTEINTTYAIMSEDESSAQTIRELQKELIEYSKNDKEFYSFINGPEVIEDFDDEHYYEENLNDYVFLTITYNLKNGNSVIREYEYKYDNKKINSLIAKVEAQNKYVNTFEYLDSLNIEYSVNQLTVNDYSSENGNFDETVIDFKDYDKVLGLLREDVDAITDNYSSLNKKSSYTNDNTSVYVRCSVPKNTNKDALDKLSQDQYSNEFIEGYINLYDYEYDEGNKKNSYELEIEIEYLPKNSKTIEFVKNYQQ